MYRQVCVIDTCSPLVPGGPDGPVSPLMPCRHRLAQVIKQLLNRVMINEEARPEMLLSKIYDDALTGEPACP